MAARERLKRFPHIQQEPKAGIPPNASQISPRRVNHRDRGNTLHFVRLAQCTPPTPTTPEVIRGSPEGHGVEPIPAYRAPPRKLLPKRFFSGKRRQQQPAPGCQ
ncbi:unnamed protein product [Ectocarpus sp. 6 AP-2014]